MNIFPLLAMFLAQQAGKASPELSPLQQLLNGPWILILGFMLIFYMTMIQPERRRRAEEAKRMSSLKKNDRVVTIGGIHGTIVSVSQDSGVVTLRVDENSNTRIKVNCAAIASVIGANKEKNESNDKESAANAKGSS